MPWRKRPLAGLKTRISAMRSPRERCCLVTRPLGGLGEPVSIIVALKDGDEMYLGTDSRFMNPEETAPVSDSVQKIHSVGPGAFIATSGYQHACSFQAARAPELARALCITDIEVIGEALARESLPTLRELVAFLSAIVQRGPAGGYKHMSAILSGEQLLHTCILAGRNSRMEVGYLGIAFQIEKGQLTYQKLPYFGRPRNVCYSTVNVPLLQSLCRQPMVYTQPLLVAIRFLLRGAKAGGALAGGPDQIAIVDGEGARWVDRLPAQPQL